jgi:hypothetical protein
MTPALDINGALESARHTPESGVPESWLEYIKEAFQEQMTQVNQEFVKIGILSIIVNPAVQFTFWDSCYLIENLEHSGTPTYADSH